MPAIQKATGFSIETIQSSPSGQLKKLTPNSASMFAERSAADDVPDVFVDRDEDGKYRVRLEDNSALEGCTLAITIASVWRLARRPRLNASTSSVASRVLSG
ncbi:MAG: hypothetical protein R3B96_20100 [Pirellulaceae bacterium]